MEKLTMLGTGHAMTMDCFNTCYVYENENGKMLVDTGGGGQLLRQMRGAGISQRDIHHIFISHRHTDHILGLPWLFRGPSWDSELNFYLHEDLMKVVPGMLELLFPDNMEHLPENVRFIPIFHGQDGEILGRKVRFLDLHSPNVPQFGYSMMLEGDRKLVFHGDVPFHESNREEIQGADWLLHEAFHLESEPPMGGPGGPGGPPPVGGPGGPKGGPGHSTVKQAAAYAESLQVKHLLLFHGTDNDLAHRKEKYIAEAAQVFSGEIFAPNDLDVIEL